MLARAAAGGAEGDWLRAVTQTGGRGRLGRTWQSPPGNLYASTIVRLRANDPPAPTLGFVAAVALEEVASVYSENVQMKWPNDLLLLSPSPSGEGLGWGQTSRSMLGVQAQSAAPTPTPPLKGRGSKLAGILLERTGDAVVIGFGVNLSHHPEDLERATASLPGAPDAADFLEDLAPAFARWVARWRGEGFAPVRARWLERAHPKGTALTVAGETGLFDGLDADGALILRLADGTRRVIHAGDVFLAEG